MNIYIANLSLLIQTICLPSLPCTALFDQANDIPVVSWGARAMGRRVKSAQNVLNADPSWMPSLPTVTRCASVGDSRGMAYISGREIDIEKHTILLIWCHTDKVCYSQTLSRVMMEMKRFNVSGSSCSCILVCGQHLRLLHSAICHANNSTFTSSWNNSASIPVLYYTLLLYFFESFYTCPHIPTSCRKVLNDRKHCE